MPGDRGEGTSTEPPGLEAFLELAQGRRSVKPRLLAMPAPSANEIRRFVEAALAAPDHGRLTPVRFLLIGPERRSALAEALAAAAREIDPDVDAEAIAAARAKAGDSPALLAMIVRIRADHPAVPPEEQLIGAGAALQNLLLAIHAAGFGGAILSGRRCATTALRQALGLSADERLAGFVSMGTPAGEPKPARRPDVADHLEDW
ncbi:MAG: nitroreductase family protein [Hyphomicrobiaceae bacterium]